ncbi:hypothetical protein BTHERMOSOX_1249 [Bathymodiolus thermophilus thioautotrophic gill symbiont]|uniref:hypothetical protein n=1 Tax=Bathymodiolus thermophilus thioautotrophic gill symbiont TaxID=2360 RepID=UPI0010BB6564|nr:hypothetical protein [Bathymodiolus thermophilus thioautotrophic gill symbiont]SGZ88924.1 hypothetical protein BTHERMOSOX_1249 [Bathymodiolus thermophilus thioautotrophic gill symbiont]
MSKSVAKIKTTSKDIFADELKKFSQIFPQFISEGKVDFDALQAFLADKDALADEKDKYTFTWAGKKQSFLLIPLFDGIIFLTACDVDCILKCE